MKLNMGCGFNRLNGYVNVDRYIECKPDICTDLEVTPWPFADAQIDEIIFNHSLEHMGKTPDIFLKIMCEIYRVCKPGANVKINVPHPRHDWFIHDPTHVRIITPETISLFSKNQNRHWISDGSSNTPLALYLNVDFEIRSVQYGIEEKYLKKLESNEITEEELELLIKERNNVAKEIIMVIEVVK